ncbi:MAG: aldo/keto reductase [Alphaproteobacteria bacterium]|jgi:aryl-alcohol dehydrogenase-like predicted oxidoreductase
MNDINDLDARQAGTFKIGGEIDIHRLGFGAMQITGAGVWGEPEDRPEALRVLERLPALGVNFIDTANSYGPDVSEMLIREVLYPYDGLLIATKAGFERPRAGFWVANGDPELLRAEALRSCEKLGVEQIALWQLHRVDPKVPREAQFAAVRALIDDGIVRHVGLSEASVEDIEAAQDVFPVATVQNLYNLVNRRSQDVLDYCEAKSIGFIPWYPLANGKLAREGSILDAVARAHDASPSQIALAWLLARSRVMLPIPGTSKVAHLEQNVAAASITLTDKEFAALDKAGQAEAG